MGEKEQKLQGQDRAGVSPLSPHQQLGIPTPAKGELPTPPSRGTSDGLSPVKQEGN